MKKILSLILVLSLSFSLYAEDKIKVYYTVDQLPDPIQFMPAPPDTLSEQFSHDIMRYFWGKQQRLDPERAAQARLDAIWTMRDWQHSSAKPSDSRFPRRAPQRYGQSSPQA